MFNFSKSTGTIDCPKTVFDNGEIKFKFSEFVASSKDISWTYDGVFFSGNMSSLNVNIAANDYLEISIENTSKHEYFLEEITICFTPGIMSTDIWAGDYYEYIHSFNLSKNSGVKKVGLKNQWLGHNPESSMIYILSEIKTGKSISFSTCHPHQGDYTYYSALHEKAHFEGRFGLKIRNEQQRVLLPNSKSFLSRIEYNTGNDPLELLTDYGKNFWKFRKKKIPIKDVKYGWNSWDYFSGAVKSEDVYSNQIELSKKLPAKIKYFVVDEGWEHRWGAWVPNWKFSEGFDCYCKKIKGHKGKAGIWTAPLSVSCYTNVYRDNPDWFVRNKSGNIVTKNNSYGTMAFLDPTHPYVTEHIHNIYTELKKCGFEYFKVDFTQEVLNGDRFFDMTTGRGNIIRHLFNTIRDAIGHDSYLLACGAPFESVTDIVDAVRIAGDIHNFWSHILSNVSEISSRWWMARNLWNTDPDFLIVRNPETSSDKRFNREYSPAPFDLNWQCGREMNHQETLVYSLMLYLTCGDMFLGDNLLKLNDTGWDVIKRIWDSPRLTQAAVPADIFKSHSTLPNIWIAKEKDFVVIGVFNWDEDCIEKMIDFEAYGIPEYAQIRSFWNNDRFTVSNGKLFLKLASRSCKGIIINY